MTHKSKCCGAKAHEVEIENQKGTYAFACEKCKDLCDVSSPSHEWQKEFDETFSEIVTKNGKHLSISFVKSFIKQVLSSKQDEVEMELKNLFDDIEKKENRVEIADVIKVVKKIIR